MSRFNTIASDVVTLTSYLVITPLGIAGGRHVTTSDELSCDLTVTPTTREGTVHKIRL